MYSETAAAAGLAYARTDDYAFEGSADATLPAIGAGVELDSVISDHLTSVGRRSVRARDLAAQPTLHNAPVVALLAFGKRGRAVASDIRHARHAPRNREARRAVPREVAGV